MDTACSSSLVALHLACPGLRLGECDHSLPVAPIILAPEMNIAIPEEEDLVEQPGRPWCGDGCRAADGYVQGEGCAFLVLRRLADAVADGDRILAVVRGEVRSTRMATVPV